MNLIQVWIQDNILSKFDSGSGFNASLCSVLRMHHLLTQSVAMLARAVAAGFEHWAESKSQSPSSAVSSEKTGLVGASVSDSSFEI
jgi:hypothetical protein